jgi:hypothetical protein
MLGIKCACNEKIDDKNYKILEVKNNYDKS